jgi:Holliday junction resolvase RusA-like endonuclease
MGAATMRTLRVVAHGEPAAQGSKKAFKRGKKIVLVEMDEGLPAWRAAVEAAARQAAGPDWETIDGPVSIAGEIRIRKPKSTKFTDYPAGPKDLDKILRSVGDALTKSGVITDDARVVHWCVKKVWAEDMPGLDIDISEIGGGHGMHD